MKGHKRSIINIPDYTVIKYYLNSKSLFEKQFTSEENEISYFLPDLLRIERSRKPTIRNNVDRIITDLNKDGKHIFFTGLKPTSTNGQHFTGDHLKWSNFKRVISLIYFVFDDDFTRFKLFYFDGYTTQSKLLQPVCKAFRTHLKLLDIWTGA